MLKLVHEQATQITEFTQAKCKQKHDTKANPSNFLFGQQVLLKVNKHLQGYSKKFEDKLRGPYYIRGKSPLDTYKIADFETNKLVRDFNNAKDLKSYYDPLNYRTELQRHEDADTKSNCKQNTKTKKSRSKQTIPDKWANRKAKPSWQDENDVSEEVKRQFCINTWADKQR